jgi:hypothetical protein
MQSGPFCCGSKGLSEVNSWALGKALSSKSSLVALNRAVGIAFDLKDPF